MLIQQLLSGLNLVISCSAVYLLMEMAQSDRKVISIGSAISINRYTAEQLITKFRPDNSCWINIQMSVDASLVMVAVAYPARGAFRLINKEVQLSLSAHTTAGASNPFKMKKDGIMAATAVMNICHITKVTEEEAMRAIKGMTSWVRQEPAAESFVYEADEAAQEGNEYVWDLYSSACLCCRASFQSRAGLRKP